MPAVSRKQFRFMKAAERGNVEGGPSPEQAREYTKKNLGKLRYGKLPEATKKPKG